MLYLLDANVLIDANRDYYPISRIPEFWGWLIEIGSKNLAKIPIEVYEEIKDGTDDLAKWAKRRQVSEALLFDEEADSVLISRVLAEGYATDLTDDEVVKLGRDPFLIAYALLVKERCVVTTEVSKPKKQRANRHVPDVCTHLGIKYCNTFEFVRDLDFRTGRSAQ